MESLNAIRNRINAVSETMKITKAMKLVSSSRIKRILKTIAHNSRYYRALTSAMADILAEAGVEGIQHPYFQGHENAKGNGKKAYIVFAGDRGLCGAYNRTVLDYAREILIANENPSLICVGQSARRYFARYPLHSNGFLLRFGLDVTLHNARNIVSAINDMYAHEYVDEVYVVYTAFFGRYKNKPVLKQVLPIRARGDVRSNNISDIRPILYEPSPKRVFDEMIPQYLISIIFDVLVQAYAGEHYARMNAMEAATQNAEEILSDLTLHYNLARQAAITNEIAEVSAASNFAQDQEG